LSRLDWRAWPMYGLAPDALAVALSLLMATVYAALLLAMAVAVFRRREFQ
jgi:hypothetical protein